MFNLEFINLTANVNFKNLFDFADCSINHNDAYELEVTFDKMFKVIRKSNIRIDWLFLNADAGFDVEIFRGFFYENDIIDNIDHNKRNGIDSKHIFDSLLYI